MSYHESPERPTRNSRTCRRCRRSTCRVGERDAQQPRRRISPKSPRQVLQPEAAPPPPPRSQKARHPLVVVLELLPDDGRADRRCGRRRASISACSASTGPGRSPKRRACSSRRAPISNSISDAACSATTSSTARSSSRWRRASKSLESKLQAGEYLFQPAVSMKQVLDDLISGRSVLHAITFPEGLDQPDDRRQAERRPDADRRDRGGAAGRLADAGHLQVHARRHAPADARPDAARGGARRAGGLEPPRAGPADRDAGRSSSRSPRSWRRRPGAPTSGRASPPSSSTGCRRACGCSPIRP